MTFAKADKANTAIRIPKMAKCLERILFLLSDSKYEGARIGVWSGGDKQGSPTD
jgi:hypothetical protein